MAGKLRDPVLTARVPDHVPSLGRILLSWAGTKITAWFLLGSVVFLYLNLFILPNTPIYRLGDEAIYLENAVKMFDGQTIYKDFFQFTSAGTEAVYFVLFKLFGVRAWIPKAVLLTLGTGIAWLAVVISRPLVGKTLALLPGLMFLVLPFDRTLDATHHWFSSFFAMAALACLMKNRSMARLAVAGALCGTAFSFTQLRGLPAAVGISVFLLWDWRRKRTEWRFLTKNLFYLWGGFLITVAAFDSFFVWKVGFRRFLWCTIIFGSKYYSAWGGNNWRAYGMDFPDFQPWPHELPFVTICLFINLLPIVYLFFIVRYKREVFTRPETPWAQIMLVNLMGLFLFIGIAPSPTYPRVCEVSPPALIILVWLASHPGRIEKTLLHGLWAGTLALAVALTVLTQLQRRAYLDLPTGRVAFREPLMYETQRWLLEHSRPSDFLFEEDFPIVNFWLGLRNPVAVPFVTTTEYTRPEQVSEIVRALEISHARYVMESVWLEFPIRGKEWGDHLGPLRTYIRLHYHPVKSLGSYEEVWERND